MPYTVIVLLRKFCQKNDASHLGKKITEHFSQDKGREKKREDFDQGISTLIQIWATSYPQLNKL